MGMTIDEAAYIIEHHKVNDINNTYDLGQAFTVAIDTMRKYQKIAELYDYWRSGKCEYTISCMENIGKVLRDGKND